MADPAANGGIAYGVMSWAEQRAWSVDYAIEALAAAGHPLAPELEAALDDLYPQAPPNPASEGFLPVKAGEVFTVGRWSIGFDAATGGISTLADSVTGIKWLTPDDGQGRLLGAAAYVTLSAEDYAVYTGPHPDGYYPMPGSAPSWFLLDFGCVHTPNTRMTVSLSSPRVSSLMAS